MRRELSCRNPAWGCALNQVSCLSSEFEWLEQFFFVKAGGLMKRLLLILACLMLCATAQAQDANITDTTDRTFFPKDTFWGYAQFDIAPPHNEIDPNLCNA